MFVLVVLLLFSCIFLVMILLNCVMMEIFHVEEVNVAANGTPEFCGVEIHGEVIFVVVILILLLVPVVIVILWVTAKANGHENGVNRHTFSSQPYFTLRKLFTTLHFLLRQWDMRVHY